MPWPERTAFLALVQHYDACLNALEAGWDYDCCVPPQVHRARLSTGEEVAVKLQYPGLKKAVVSDLGTLKRLTMLAAVFFPEFRQAL